MRGSDAASGALFSYVDMEARVPATHPLRTIRTIVNEVLAALDIEFEALYEGTGRQSVAPERLLRASLLQAFYSVRSERQLATKPHKRDIAAEAQKWGKVIKSAGIKPGLMIRELRCSIGPISKGY